MFTRGSIPLYFSGLIIANMAVDILGGTNFLIKNDIAPRMAKGTISIRNSCTVLAASPTLLALDWLDTRLRLIKVTKHVELVPGEYATLALPQDLPRDAHLVVEPNCSQTAPFFPSNILQAEDGTIAIQNQSMGVVSLKKNSQPVLVRVATSSSPTKVKYPNPAPELRPRSVTQILDQACLDVSKTLSKQQKALFVATITKYSQVFQPDLPGYNNSFGRVFADFQFASSARPPSQKVFTPAYGPHGKLLLHQKFLFLK